MLPIESIAVLIEKYVKQLESLAHSKNAALAAKLSGAIEASVTIAQVTADSWNARVEVAMKNVMADPVNVPDMTDKNLPMAIKTAPNTQSAGASKTNQPLTGDAGLPQIDTGGHK